MSYLSQLVTFKTHLPTSTKYIKPLKQGQTLDILFTHWHCTDTIWNSSYWEVTALLRRHCNKCKITALPWPVRDQHNIHFKNTSVWVVDQGERHNPMVNTRNNKYYTVLSPEPSPSLFLSLHSHSLSPQQHKLELFPTSSRHKFRTFNNMWVLLLSWFDAHDAPISDEISLFCTSHQKQWLFGIWFCLGTGWNKAENMMLKHCSRHLE